MKTLSKNAINVWGDKGKRWLKQLPEILSTLTCYWKLSDITPVNNMTYNYVAKAMQNENVPVVIKISCDKQLIENEHFALSYFDGKGSVRVLDVYADLNAMLIEQAIPGMLLKAHQAININKTIDIYADVIKELASQNGEVNSANHVRQWCQAIDRIDDKRIDVNYIQKAQELRDYLLGSVEHEYLCHGDLHLENIISHADKWLSIDPKGVVGEIAFEASAFDLIHKSEWAYPELIPSKVINRVNLLADVIGVDKSRLLGWIFLRIIISAQWFIEDNDSPDEMLSLASIFYPMLTKRYYKNNVCLTYEKISDWYDKHRCEDLFEKYHLDYVIEHISQNSEILDIGCGTGQPIAEYFIKNGFTVIGVAGSPEQLKKANYLVPEMQTICSDMRHINLKREFDCIIAWHSFFHLSQNDQREMFKVFEQHIKPNGILIFTSGICQSEVWSDNGGEMLYHPSLSADEYRLLMQKYHFDLLLHRIEDPGCGNATIWIGKSNKLASSYDTLKEINISLSLVKRLIANQFLEYTQLPIRSVEKQGHDNRTFRLGQDMLVRMPSAKEYAEKVAIEQKLLPLLQPHLTVDIPIPIAMGQPSNDYPFPFSIYRWVEGISANLVRIDDITLNIIAAQLATFLKELQSINTLNGPAPGQHNWWRVDHISVYDKGARQQIHDLSGIIDIDKAIVLWQQACDTKWSNAPVWIHGDFASGNILIRDGKLNGIIDFGGIAVGDPACDLVLAWTFLRGQSRKIFKEILNIDSDTWLRAKAWCLWKATYKLCQIEDKNSNLAAIQKDIINQILI